ncbi:MAG: translation initiation factor IF-2 [Fimbriimonadaceae bacterium]|nr:MAG: translation initiation factor IF-2 [Armatimonadetes bacterium OLB18]MCK6631942.1 translation initiation factor IF-2 [Fimbriimonadaceae bacterium]MCZ7580408.1 translation initiation factor IF-2 [Fimbriimonadaceae bacterium]
MSLAIADVAKEFGLKPGQVAAALDDLGLLHEGGSIDVDADDMELVRESLAELDKGAEVLLPANCNPRDVATALDLTIPEVQKTLMVKFKVMATLTTSLKPEVAEQLVDGFGFKVRWADQPKPKAAAKPKKPSAGDQTRPPVVTIMGHVDHGKTSLLDYIRKANVAAREHGGITQHIGAYQVKLPEGEITFLDTPGHAAFTEMRSRGAQVTDIAILVVAADDGVMPQTKEAISHIKNAGVPMIVAVNKIDKPGVNPDKIKTELVQHEVIPEDFGGDVIVCPVSAITGEGVPHLLEMILLQSGVLDLKADPKGKPQGVVVEAKLEKGRGPVATVLVQNGTIRVGDAIVVGQCYGRIRAMSNFMGEAVQEAGPSMPVEVLGLSETPLAGDKVEVKEDEKTAREISDKRADAARIKSLHSPSRGLSLTDLKAKLSEGEINTLNLIIKADVQGSVEAVRGLVEKLQHPEVEVKIIHSGVGTITESDILLAGASSAIVVGFNVKPEGGAKTEAERKKVEIRTYRIIYELIEDIEAAIKGRLEPKFEENYLGEVEIRQVFNLTRQGKVAGCHVTDGRATRGARCRVHRGEDIVYDGKIASLRHVKDDVREVTQGFDCGVKFDDWEAFLAGDKIEVFELVQVNA